MPFCKLSFLSLEYYALADCIFEHFIDAIIRLNNYNIIFIYIIHIAL